MCGEKRGHGHYTQYKQGSPPRVRGKGFSVYSFDVLKGITPACAGKRNLLKGFQVVVEDHPRVCGEKPEED